MAVALTKTFNLKFKCLLPGQSPHFYSQHVTVAQLRKSASCLAFFQYRSYIDPDEYSDTRLNWAGWNWLASGSLTTGCQKKGSRILGIKVCFFLYGFLSVSDIYRHFCRSHCNNSYVMILVQY